MPQSIAHVALVVSDYDEAIAWFTGKLGFSGGSHIYVGVWSKVRSYRVS